MSNGSKQCSRCGQVKSLDEFYRCSRVRDGRQASCKECRKAQRLAYRERENELTRRRYWASLDESRRKKREGQRKWREANPEKARDAKRKWRERDPEKARRLDREQARRWRKRNLEYARQKERERTRALAGIDPTVRREKHRRWRQANPEKVRANGRQVQHRRRARMRRGRVYTVTAKNLRYLHAAACLACGAPADTIDHVIPLRRGGSHGVGNLAPMCRTCNSSKGAKTITEWRKANDWLPLGSFPRRKDRADGAA